MDILMTAVLGQPRRSRRPNWGVLGVGVITLLASVFAVALLYADLPGIAHVLFSSVLRLRHHRGDAELCPQSDALYPERHAQLWKSLGRDFDEDAFTTRAVMWLGGAVRIRYVSILF